MKSSIIFWASAVVVYILQVAFAPHIAVFGVIPNFILAFSLATSLTSSYKKSIIVSFVSGLVYDSISGGVVGISSTLYLAACFLIANRMSQGSLSPISRLALAVPVLCFGVNLSNTFISYLLGVSTGPLLSQLLAVVISTLCSYALALLLYFILGKASGANSGDAFSAIGSSVANVGKHSDRISTDTLKVKTSRPNRKSIKKKKWS